LIFRFGSQWFKSRPARSQQWQHTSHVAQERVVFSDPRPKLAVMAERFYGQFPRVQAVRPQLPRCLASTLATPAIGCGQDSPIAESARLDHNRFGSSINDTAQLGDLRVICVLLRLENFIHARSLFTVILKDFALERIRAIVWAG